MKLLLDTYIAIVYDWERMVELFDRSIEQYMKILLVNACARRASRTYRLTKALEDRLSTGNVVEDGGVIIGTKLGKARKT